jgi:hypothetical protein
MMRRATLAIGLALALAGVASAPAGAATISPATANFGNQPVGSVSAPRAFTLTPQLLDVLPLTIATTGDFRQTNNCAPVLQLISGPCTISVTFAPTAAGSRSGTLSSTALILGGPSSQLSGTGTEGTSTGGGGGKPSAKCKKKKGKKKRGKKGVDSAVAAKKKKGKKKCKKRKKKGNRKK